MVFVGIGIGASMPLLNIAVQSEFDQKDLGMVTSSNQLFRGLGSTIGVAVFGSMLTLGMTSALGNMGNNAYVQTLRKSPAASQILTDPSDVNTLLTLNMPDTKKKITTGFETGIAAMEAPQPVKDQLRENFTTKQQAYSNVLTEAFAASIHKIFMISAGIMLLAFFFSLAIKERPLHAAKPTETPGEL